MSEKVSITIKVNEEGLNKIVEHYKSYQKDNNGEYILFFAKKKDTTITIYSNKKSKEYKVLFSGEDAVKEAKTFNKTATINNTSNNVPTKASWICLDNQIGSDEVGTGDFFGPITVCAALVKASDIERLKELGVDDSKRLTDDQIRKLGPILIKEFKYSNLSLDNLKYNEIYTKRMNMNAMKAKMHNRVLLNLSKKYPSVKNIFVDQFCNESTFYEYLQDTDSNEVIKGITFKTKGETWFPCVAVASIIARYSFIYNMDEMSKKYKIDIPYGAGSNVTEFAKKFVKKYGVEELNKIVKKNFANYDEVIQLKLL